MEVATTTTPLWKRAVKSLLRIIASAMSVTCARKEEKGKVRGEEWGREEEEEEKKKTWKDG